MFTSITNLRKSHAQSDRVDSVERNLKKLNPNWNADWYFPIIAIGLSNVADDIDWVTYNRSVHLRSSPASISVLGTSSGTPVVTATALNQAVRDLHPTGIAHSRKSAVVNSTLTAMNVALAEVFRIENFDWSKNPLVEGEAVAEPALQQVQSNVIPAVTQKVEVKAETTDDTWVAKADEARAEGFASDAEVQELIKGVALTMQEAFEIAFATEKLDFTKNASGKGYARDRVQGKFIGFAFTINAIKAGTINAALIV